MRRFTEAERTALLAAVNGADLGTDDSDRRKIVDRIRAAQ